MFRLRLGGICHARTSSCTRLRRDAVTKACMAEIKSFERFDCSVAFARKCGKRSFFSNTVYANDKGLSSSMGSGWMRYDKGYAKVLVGGLAIAGGFVAWTSGGGAAAVALGDDGLPLEYDVNAIKRFWDREPRIVLWRLSQIVNTAGPFMARTAWDWQRGKLVSEDQQRARGAEMREALFELGPAFIKLGQLLSTRPDLLPQPVLEELRQLCDNVPSFPTSLAIEIIRKEIGQEGLEKFEDFTPDTQPIAAASLGQVYKLRLRGSDDVVAVKVQRPEMLRLVSLDLYLLRKWSQFVELSKSGLMKLGVLSPRKQYDVQLLDSFATASYLELDYENEGRNQDRFRLELLPLLKDQVRVPNVMWPLTSRKVLTSEWIEGTQLVKSSPETIKRLVPIGVECFLKQLLEVGYFHSDPHTANLLVDDDGKLCLIDFGLCAAVPLPDTVTMTSAIVHLMQGDVPGLLEDAVQLGFLPSDVDKEGLIQDLETIFRESKIEVDAEIRATLAMRREPVASRYAAIESRRKKFKDVSKELNAVFFEYPFLVPDYFALITRALIILEGIAVIGDPSFDIFGAAYPYASQRSLKMFSKSDLWQIGKATVSAASSSKVSSK